MLIEERGHRASPDTVRRRRIAKDFVSPLNRKIGSWAEQAVFLRARINGRRIDVEARAAARAEAGGLTHSVVREMAKFEHELTHLPADIRKSSEIEDTYRAMQSVIRNLRQSLVAEAPEEHQS
jgi:hypothetical protein